MSTAPSPLLQLLADDPTDRQRWSVYADALLSSDPRDPWGLAICACLADQRPELTSAMLGPAADPDRLDVAWRMGLWQAAWVRPSGLARPGQVRTALRHPSAVLLERLVVPQSALGGDALEHAPCALRSLELLEGPGPLDPAVLAPIAGQLQQLVLHGPARALRGLVAPALRRLSLHDCSRLPELQLPALEVLELDQIDPLTLPELPVEGLPALHTLAIRSSAEPVALEALLRAPWTQQLRRLEVRGPQELVELGALGRHLQLLVIDAPGGARTSLPHVRLRSALEPHGETLVRLSPPTTPLQQALALQQAAQQLGMRLDPAQLPRAAWLSVPEDLGAALAGAMASGSRQPAQRVEVEGIEERHDYTQRLVLRVFEHHPDGRCLPTEIPLSRREWLQHPDLNAYEHDSSPHLDDLYEALWSELDLVQIALWSPRRWRPDPYGLARPAPSWPTELSRAGQRHPLQPQLARYLAWRLRVSGLWHPTDPPDLSRWSRRLLSRHRLGAPPPRSHPYWADLEQRTQTERSVEVPAHHAIPSFKLGAVGRWILTERESRWLWEALAESLADHEPPAELLEGYEAVIDFLGGGGPIEIGITPAPWAR